MNILIVDDKKDSRYLLEYVLAGDGHDVRVAANGQEALEKLSTGRVDLIISDVLMPEMDGFELCRSCKRDPDLAPIPFIFLTATYTEPKDEDFARSIGADAYVVKPVEPHRLREIIEVVTHLRKPAKPVGADPNLSEEQYLRLYSERLVHKLEQKLDDLRISEAKFRTLFETLPVGVVYHDAAGHTVLANEAAESMLGTLLGTPFAAGRIESGDPSLVDENGAPLPASNHPSRNAFLTGQRVTQTAIGVGEEKGYRWLRLDATPIFQERDDKPYQVYSVYSDITEVKETRDRLRQITESVSVYIFEVDQSGVVLFANRVWEGLTREQVEGTPLVRWFPEEHREQLDKLIEEGFQSDKPMSFPYQAPDLTGAVIHYDCTVSRIQRSGRGATLLLTAVDVTQEKKADAERASLEEQLHQSQKMEAIGRLAGGVAHDFNNMLTAIQGFTEFILEAVPPDDPIAGDAAEILRAAESSAALTQQLLAFSRRQIISPRVLNLNDVVAKSQKMLKRVIGEDINLRFHPGANLDNVRLDPVQVEQVLVNLAVNARDAMPAGGALTLETSSVDLDGSGPAAFGKEIPSGRFVRLAVSDNGSGIPPENLDSIFEPFFTTKERGRGTGLGLSTVYGILKQNGGYINVYSEVGVGTTFKLYFPVSNVRTPAVETGDAADRLQGNETVLLVEDEAVLRRLGSRILTSFGYRVVEAEDGVEALDAFREADPPIDILVTDVVMPRMGGVQLRQILSEEAPELKTLFMSGYTEDAIIRNGMLPEKANFILKPFRPQELAVAVRKILDS